MSCIDCLAMHELLKGLRSVPTLNMEVHPMILKGTGLGWDLLQVQAHDLLGPLSSMSFGLCLSASVSASPGSALMQIGNHA